MGNYEVVRDLKTGKENVWDAVIKIKTKSSFNLPIDKIWKGTQMPHQPYFCLYHQERRSSGLSVNTGATGFMFDSQCANCGIFACN